MNEAIEARMRQLRRRFARSAPAQAAALRRALAALDRDRTIEVAHHLAGASAIFGHPEIGDLASRLEYAIERGDPPAAIAQLSDRLLSMLDMLSAG